MAAGKGKEKKGKKERKKKEKINMVPNVLTEVDRTFYELHIADVNRKINRLNELIDKMKTEQEQCEDTYKQAEEERTEQINFLSNTLKERNNEIRSLNEAIIQLDETEEEEIKAHEEKVKELDEKYETTRRELTAQNKELEGIYNTLEEFSQQQEKLEAKYEEQEAYLEEREIQHKAEMEEIERKFQIVKQKLKRGMEAKLLQLSTEFQEKSEAQMPATTHRMVRENVAIHNELDLLLLAEHKLQDENKILKEKNKEILQSFHSHQSNRLYLLEQTKFQNSVVQELKKKYDGLRTRIQSIFEANRYEEFHNIITQIIKQQMAYDQLLYHNNALKRNLHGLKCRKERLQFSCSDLNEKNNMLQYILIEAVCAIEQALGPENDKTSRQDLIEHLLHILTTIEIPIEKTESLNSIASMRFEGIKIEDEEEEEEEMRPYITLKHAVHTTRQNAASQTSRSMEELSMFEEKSESSSSKASVPPIVVQEEESEDIEVSSTFSTKFYNDQESSHSSVEDTTETTSSEEQSKESEDIRSEKPSVVEHISELEGEEENEEESEKILLEIMAEQESIRSFHKSIVSLKSVEQSEQSVKEEVSETEL